jgi:hypothetical protein
MADPELRSALFDPPAAARPPRAFTWRRDPFEDAHAHAYSRGQTLSAGLVLGDGWAGDCGGGGDGGGC